MSTIPEAAPTVRRFLDGAHPGPSGQWAFADSLQCAGVVYPYERVEDILFEVHQDLEIGIVLSGEIERRAGVGPTLTRLRAGEAWLSPMWEPHGGRVIRPGSCVAVLFLPGFLGEERIGDLSWFSFFAAPPEDRPQATTAAMRRQTMRIARRLCIEIRDRRPGFETGLRLALLELLLVLFRGWDPASAQRRQALSSTGLLPRVLPALELAQARHGVRLSLADAADACGFSVSHFKRVFRQAMGVSFGQFCLHARLALVANQLMTTELPEQSIAEESGFGDASHLHHSFHKHFGTTPGRYRRRMRCG
jgi:AraC-like DNA-binding protein